jgi:hypothetical protein
MNSYDNKIYYLLNKNNYLIDISDLTNIEANYIAYHECIIENKIHISLNKYFTYFYTHPIGYILNREMKLIFNDYMYASTQRNLKLIMSLHKWFKIVKHHDDTDSCIRYFYNKYNDCIAFDENSSLFCYNDNNEWNKYDVIKKLYVKSIFNDDYEIKFINDILVINDQIYCCENDYLEVYELACYFEFKDKDKENYKKILHIIYINEQEQYLYLDISCFVKDCEDKSMTFSNDKVYLSYEDYKIDIKYNSYPKYEFGMYTSPNYKFLEKS